MTMLRLRTRLPSDIETVRSSPSEPRASTSMAFRNLSFMVGLMRTLTQIASMSTSSS